MQRLIKSALKYDYEEDASILAKAVNICREDIFQEERFNFDGSFHLGCQEKSVPATLKMLIAMLLNGTGLKQQDNRDSQQCLTICQTILFNCKNKGSQSDKQHHASKAEAPLPLYLGLRVWISESILKPDPRSLSHFCMTLV